MQLAEQILIAANARIGVAKAAQFLTFSLTGSFGSQSASMSDLFKNTAKIWSIGPLLNFPIIDGGKYSARTQQAEARHRQSVADYRKTIEDAFRDVADTLVNLEYTTAAVSDVNQRLEAARQALKLSRLRYESGYSGYLDVLDAQRSANIAELAFIQHRQAQLTYSVDFFKALGGGWSTAQNVPVAQQQ